MFKCWKELSQWEEVEASREKGDHVLVGESVDPRAGAGSQAPKAEWASGSRGDVWPNEQEERKKGAQMGVREGAYI